MKFINYAKIILLISLLSLNVDCSKIRRPTAAESTADNQTYYEKMANVLKGYWENIDRFEMTKCWALNIEYAYEGLSTVFLPLFQEAKKTFTFPKDSHVYINRKTFSLSNDKDPLAGNFSCQNVYIKNFFHNCVSEIPATEGEDFIPAGVDEKETVEPEVSPNEQNFWGKFKSYAAKAYKGIKKAIHYTAQDAERELKTWKNPNESTKQLEEEYNQMKDKIEKQSEDKAGLISSFIHAFTDMKKYFNCGYKNFLVTLKCYASKENLEKLSFSISRRMIIYIFFYGLLSKYRLLKTFYRFTMQVYSMIREYRNEASSGETEIQKKQRNSCNVGKLGAILTDGIYSAFGLSKKKKLR